MNLSDLHLILKSESKPTEMNEVQRLARRLVAEIGTDLPYPGEGKTPDRLKLLAVMGGFDLSVAKLVESHFDALAILREARINPYTGVYGVWASKFGGKHLLGERDQKSGLWMIQGELAFASGVSTVDHILVPVSTPEGEILFQIPKESILPDTVDLSRWHTPGMKDADTAWVRIEAQLPDSESVGEAGFYLNRSGFWAGALGVAACWLGAAQSLFLIWHQVAQTKSYQDPHDQAARADCFSSLKACTTQMMACATLFDDGRATRGLGMTEALMVRHLVDRAANDVIDRSMRSSGPMLMVGNAEFSRRVADLQIFTRQCHGNKDLVHLCVELEKSWADQSFENREVWFE